jgi:hypothetical protein
MLILIFYWKNFTRKILFGHHSDGFSFIIATLMILAGYKKLNPPTGKSRVFFMMLILLSTILLVLGIFGLFM